ncbi:MAG: type II toxin-antitoxin system RelE family toxin [Pontimonas sp.]
MTYLLRFTPGAAKQLAKLDKQHSTRIRAFLEGLHLANPRFTGRALIGEGSYWRYRVGDYRIIAHISERELLVLVVAMGHRRKIYRGSR